MRHRWLVLLWWQGCHYNRLMMVQSDCHVLGVCVFGSMTRVSVPPRRQGDAGAEFRNRSVTDCV